MVLKPNIIRAKVEIRNFGDAALRALRKYPAKPSGSRYRRTFELRKGWTKDVMVGPNVGIFIFNDRVNYAGWVQGRRFTGAQRQLKRFTRQGWTSLTDVQRTIWPKYQLRIALALGITPRSVRRLLIPRGF